MMIAEINVYGVERSLSADTYTFFSGVALDRALSLFQAVYTFF